MLKQRIFIGFLLTLLTGSVSSQSFHVGTYNLRYANHGGSVKGNGWGQRLPVIAELSIKK